MEEGGWIRHYKVMNDKVKRRWCLRKSNNKNAVQTMIKKNYIKIAK